MRSVFFSLSLFLGLAMPAHATEPCERYLLPAPDLAAYLEILFEEQFLSVVDIERFAQQLEHGELMNPMTARTAGALVHARTLDQMLQRESNLGGLRTWARNFLETRRAVDQQRERTEGATQPNILDLNFIRVPGRIIVNPDVAQEYDVGDFEISDTLISEHMFAQEMDPDSVLLSVHEDALNAPVTELSWWSALVYANRVSRRHGLRPVYDEEGIVGDDPKKFTRQVTPEQNRVLNRAGTQILRTFEGYRLPSFHEILLINQLYRGSGELAPLNDPDEKFQFYLHDWMRRTICFGRYIGKHYSSDPLEPNDYDRTVGFRLVRSLPPPKP